MILIEDFIWILLENDIWWPGILIKQRNQYLNIRSSSNNNNNHIVKLFGTEELISIDLSLLKNKNERIIFYSTNKNINFFNLYNQQNNIPDELKEYFKEAISLLNKYCLECHQQEKQGEEKQGEEKEKSIEVITTQIENQSQNEIQTNQIDSSISSNSSHSNSNSNQLSLKREDALSWDDYFIAVAFLSAMRSKDPSTQVGACIVNKKFRIVGIGYNGFPRGCSDDILPWARVADNELDTKYPVSFYIINYYHILLLNLCIQLFKSMYVMLKLMQS